MFYVYQNFIQVPKQGNIYLTMLTCLRDSSMCSAWKLILISFMYTQMTSEDGRIEKSNLNQHIPGQVNVSESTVGERFKVNS